MNRINTLWLGSLILSFCFSSCSVGNRRTKNIQQSIANEIAPLICAKIVTEELPEIKLQNLPNYKFRYIAPQNTRVFNGTIWIMASSEQASKNHEIAYVFRKVPEFGGWYLQAAWVTDTSGGRRLLPIPKQKIQSGGSANQNHKEGYHIVIDETLEEINPNQYPNFFETFERLVARGDLPHMPDTKNIDMNCVGVLPPPGYLERTTHATYGEVYVGLKNGAGALIYLLNRVATQNNWVFSSVLRLNADGTAVMLPVK